MKASTRGAEGRMAEVTQLRLRLAGGAAQPAPGRPSLDEHDGGPEVLLRWLETQLGLLSEPVPLSHRVSEYAAILERVPDACYSRSLLTDRWGTAEELLLRREELRLGGWDEEDRPELPPLVRDLARAARAERPSRPDAADRLRRVAKALERGRALPPHRCVLE